jgi:predicted  nucleic acid-binding Zn-ribbon protein
MDKDKGKVKDITVEILISIRDEIKNLREGTDKRFEQLWVEIKNLREDTNKRFEQMDKRFELMDKRLEHIEADIRAIVSHFDRDYMLLANKIGTIEGRLDAHLQEAHQ